MAIDWFFWKNMSQVALWQASFLACNIDPYNMDYLYIERLGLENDNVHRVLELVKSSLHKRQFFSPGILNMGDPNLNGVRLPEFAAWCLNIGLDIPKELADLANTPQQAETVRDAGAGKQDDTELAGVKNGAKKQRTRKINLSHAIDAAIKTFSRKPSFDELWQFFQEDKEETGFILDYTDARITWVDTKGKLHDTQKETLANHLSRVKS